MRPVVVNAVGILNRVYTVPGLNHPNAVFDREYRQAPVVGVAGNDGAKTERIDLPVPLGGLQVRVIFLAVQQVIIHRRAFRDRIAVQRFTGVIAEGHIVILCTGEQRQVLSPVDIAKAFLLHHRHHRRAVALACEDAQQILVEELVVLLGAEDIARFAGGRVNQLVRQHAAHQLARLSLVQVFGQRHVRHHGVML